MWCHEDYFSSFVPFCSRMYVWHFLAFLIWFWINLWYNNGLLSVQNFVNLEIHWNSQFENFSNRTGAWTKYNVGLISFLSIVKNLRFDIPASHISLKAESLIPVRFWYDRNFSSYFEITSYFKITRSNSTAWVTENKPKFYVDFSRWKIQQGPKIPLAMIFVYLNESHWNSLNRKWNNIHWSLES